MKSILSVCAAFLLPAILHVSGFTVDRVSIQQRWPWSQKIDVDYLLEGAASGATADVSLRMFSGDKELEIPSAALSGDRIEVVPGFRRLTVDPKSAGWIGEDLQAVSAVVTAAETPLYVIIDLTKAKGEVGGVTYLTATDLADGSWGPCETNAFADVGLKSIIWTGVTNDAAYATTKLVLRRIPAATFKLGYLAWDAIKTGWIEPTTEITLTKPYYIGVYPITQDQYSLIMKANPSVFKTEGATRPVDSPTYQNMQTFCSALSGTTGFACGLPTYAQWEYAANTGFTTPFCSGVLQKYTSTTWETVLTAMVAPYGCCGRSSATTDVAPDVGGTVKVGGYLPNGYGLYDVHGNVWEAVVDYYNASYDYATDPIDPTGAPTATENNKHMRVGGSFTMKAEYARAHYRGYDFAENKGNVQTGFRIVINPF